MLIHKGPLQDFDINRLEAQLVKRDRRRLYIAFGAAILLHASTVVGFTYWTPPEAVAPPGDMVITIDLAPAVYSTAAEATAGQSSESAPQMETEPETEPEEPEVVELPEPEPIEPPEEVVEEVPVPEPQPEAETVQENIETPPPAEEPAVALAPRKIEKPKVEKKKKQKQTATANSQAAASANQQRSDVGGSGAKANPSELAQYIGRLRAALERSKRYPSAAGGARGTASLRFTVSRSGAVTGFTIVRSSGNAALDAATRQMIQSASLPAIPPGLPDSLTVGVPVNFQVR